MAKAEHGRAWAGRPVLARLVKTVATLGPIVVATATSVLVGRTLPPASSAGQAVLIWLLLAAIATVVLVVVERAARRLLPLSALLKLTLVFPDQAPSRFKVARGTATTRQLADEVERAREHGLGDDRTAAAESVLKLVAALSIHDRGTRGHAERTRIFTDMIAEELDLPVADRDRLRWAALLHDVGKIAVHTDILNKPGRPTDEEWKALRSHPQEGAKLIAPLRSWLGPWAVTVDQHHEQWDGSGYPLGLAGTEISLGARIVGLADAYDVMTAARPYKEARTAREARQELADCAGAHFDPMVVRAFLRIAVGRLRWAAGPLSWISSAAGVRVLPQVGANAGLATSLLVASVGAISLTTQTAPAAPAVVEIAASEEPVELERPAPPAVVPVQSTDVGTSPAGDPTAALVLHEDGVGTIELLAEEGSPGDGTVTLTFVEEPAPRFGELRWGPTGRVEFTPTPDASGRTTLAYELTTDAGVRNGSLTLDVEPVNDAPSATPPRDLTARSDGSTTRVPGWLTGILPGPPDEGGQQVSVTIDTTGTATFTQAPAVDDDGQLTFRPAPGSRGRATLTVTLVDDGGTDRGGVDTTQLVALLVIAAPADPAPVLPSPRPEPNPSPTGGATGPTPPSPTPSPKPSPKPSPSPTATPAPEPKPSTLYLGSKAIDARTSELSTTPPSARGNPVPDWDGDGAPGRTVKDSGQKKDEDDPEKVHDWLYAVPSSLRIDGAVTLTLTSAVEELQGGKDVDYTAFLDDCNAAGTGCTELARVQDVHVDDWNPDGAWSTRTLTIGTVNHTVTAGRVLRLRLLFDHKDVWIALTADRPSHLNLPVR